MERQAGSQATMHGRGEGRKAAKYGSGGKGRQTPGRAVNKADRQTGSHAGKQIAMPM
jgi:hypothetical protein